MKKAILFSLLMVVFLLSACMTGEAGGPQTALQSTVVATTPTPEIFIPLDPSPTPLESNLPLSCQVTDLQVYMDEVVGFCFAYPAEFSLDGSVSQAVSLVGPALDQSAEPLRASLRVEVQPVPENSNLTRLVDAFLSQSGFQNLPWTIERSSLNLGGEPAEMLAPTPGLGSARVVIALHGNSLYTLWFKPVEQEAAKSGLEALYQTVTGSFAFFEGTGNFRSSNDSKNASWVEFGQAISLEYDPALAPWVDIVTVPAVPEDGDQPYFGTHPAYADFRFLGFQGGRIYQLPFVPGIDHLVAHVTVFQTADFPGYGDDSYFGFPGQLQALSELLQNGVDPARCSEPLYAYEESLPFLPWVNSKQTFCADLQILDFQSGKGLRYLTYYSQGIDPVLDYQVFYTFQGLSADGKFYISASFPVATRIFPTELPKDLVNYSPDQFFQTLAEQVQRLNEQDPERIEPALARLDALVSSIRIGTP